MRRLLEGLVGVALALAVTGCTSAGPGADEGVAPGPAPARLDALPAGEQARLAYVRDTELVLPDGERIEVPTGSRVVQGGGQVLVVDVPEGPGIRPADGAVRSRVRAVEGGRLQSVTLDAVGLPVISADGAVVAWAGTGPDGRVFVDRWQRDGSRSGSQRIEVAFSPTCCTRSFALAGVTEDGVTYGSGGGATWAAPLDVRTPPAPVDLDGDALLQVTGDGGMLTVGASGTRFGRLREERFVAIAEVDGWATALVSPDAQSMVLLGARSVIVRDLGDGTNQTVLDVGDQTVDIVGWEDDTSVLLSLAESPGVPAARCHTDGTCESVGD